MTPALADTDYGVLTFGRRNRSGWSGVTESEPRTVSLGMSAGASPDLPVHRSVHILATRE
jgi:hypothetical protein